MRREIMRTKAQPKAQSEEAKAKRIQTRRFENTLNTKLTRDDVCAIRAAYATPTPNGVGRKQRRNGGVTLKGLAEEYGVGILTIYDVVKWKTWKIEPQHN